MKYSAEMRRCLEEVDVAAMRRLSRHLFPHLPEQNSDMDVITSIHIARTQASWLAFKKRAYSHAWLTDRAMPSSLPDNLRPRAERLYPRVVEGVGIASRSAGSHDELKRMIGLGSVQAMSNVVNDYYATDRLASPDPVKVHDDMLRERKEFRRRVADVARLGWRRG